MAVMDDDPVLVEDAVVVQGHVRALQGVALVVRTLVRQRLAHRRATDRIGEVVVLRLLDRTRAGHREEAPRRGRRPRGAPVAHSWQTAGAPSPDTPWHSVAWSIHSASTT